MTALSEAYEVERQDGELVDVPVKSTEQVWKGGLVADVGTGFAQSGADATADAFLGVAAESVLGGSTDGATTVRVYKTGSFKYTLTGGALATDLGVRVFIGDDQTVRKSTTNSVGCGYIVKIVDTTFVKVRIDRDVQ